MALARLGERVLVAAARIVGQHGPGKRPSQERRRFDGRIAGRTRRPRRRRAARDEEDYEGGDSMRHLMMPFVVV
jgi:hypothetical protein